MIRPLERVIYRARKSRLAFSLNQRRLRIEARRGSSADALRAVPNPKEPVVAITYDDGPSPENTPELLEILASAGARATFFVVGSEVARHPELAARIVAAGHELGNHSYSHPNSRDLDDEGTRLEMERSNLVIAQAAVIPSLYRPPFGKQSRAQAQIGRGVGLTSVLWSVDSGDTMPFSSPRIVAEVVGRVHPGDIVLMHDGGTRRQRTLDATSEILRQLGEDGYRFVTVSELLNRQYGEAPEGRAAVSRHEP
jgi:peptidoglycan/xylan/chitin deacetylase (PgdA/CDA1 family)